MLQVPFSYSRFPIPSPFSYSRRFLTSRQAKRSENGRFDADPLLRFRLDKNTDYSNTIRVDGARGAQGKNLLSAGYNLYCW